MREVRIAGVGLTPHGHFPHLNWLELARAAVDEARSAAAFDPSISVYVGSAAMSVLTGEQFLAARLANALQLEHAATVDVAGGEAAGALALRAAWLDVASGVCESALVVGVETWSGASVERQAAALAGLTAGNESGLTRDIVAGLITNAYGQQVDDLELALDAVARKNHANAIHNPQAFHRRALDVSTLRDAPIVAAPLTTAHAADQVDGAAAVWLVAAEQPADAPQLPPVRIAGIGSSSVSVALSERESPMSNATPTAARAAYKQANCGPEAIDVVEVDDVYAIHEFLSLEGIRWYEPSQAAEATLRGETGFEGPRPVNPSGGLLGLGHALGAGGLAAVVAIARQVAGEAGVMQVAGVKRGLAHNLGGAGALAVVTILERVDG